jgi:ligand-binding SRPBCC domain-containing protein
VLGRDGGALAAMRPAFRLGFGGPLGSGRQHVPWIHLGDLVRIVLAALQDARYRGPINAVAPESVTSATLARALGDALGRPALVPAPAIALRARFGEGARVLLDSARVVPERLRALGFRFEHPDIASALADIEDAGAVSIDRLRGRLLAVVQAETGLSAPRPTHVLRATTIVDAPLASVFAYFSRAENLGAITPRAMDFRIEATVPPIEPGARIDYRVRVGGIPLRWRTRIAAWEPTRRFVDVQERGPYRTWWHEHTFRPDGDRTVMEDRVYYAPPFGPLGRLANRLFIVPQLRRIFAYRGEVIRWRFNGVPVDR